MLDYRRALATGVLMLAVLVVASPAAAQVPPLRRPELPAALVDAKFTALLQDHRGYLWGATSKGVVMFSGTEVRLFTVRDSLASNDVTALFEDKEGMVWTGHRSGALSRYDGRQFRSVSLPEGNPTKAILSFAQDSFGNLWIGTKGEGLYYVAHGRSYLYTAASLDDEEDESQESKKADSLSLPPSDEFNSLLAGSTGDVWAATDAGMTRAVPTAGETTDGRHRFENLSQRNGLPDNYVRHLSLDPYAGLVWVTMADSGVTTFDPKTRRYGRMRGFPRVQAEATLPVKGGVWVAASSGGLLYWERKTGRVLRLTAAQGLASDKSRCLLVDREGSVWVGGEPGLTQVLGERFQTLAAREVAMPQTVNSIWQDRRGDIWVGSDTGVTRITAMPDGGLKTRRYLAGRAGRGSNVVLGIAEDRQGRIWVGSAGNGLFVIDPATDRITSYAGADWVTAKELNEVSHVICDSSGTLWVGTLGGGLIRMDLSGGAPRVRVFTTEDGLAGDYISQITASRDRKTIWVATPGNGFARFSAGKWSKYGKTQGLVDENMIAVRELPDGQVFALTVEAGLFQLTKDSRGRDTLLHVPTFGEELGAQPKALLVDTKGRLVLPDFRRLGVYDPRLRSLSTFDAEDGLANFDPIENSAYIDRQGVVWVGTKHGLVRYDPQAETPRQEPPPVFFTRFQVNQKDANLTADTTFAPGDNSLSFGFVAANLSNPRRVVYSYRLRTEDDSTWQAPTRSTSVSFPGLAPGSYVFEVRASVQEGVWTVMPQRYAFTISPPWYQRWEFWTGLAVLVIGGLFFYFRQRERQIMAENLKLERKVQERTAEVVRQKDEIEGKNKMLEDANEEITAKNGQITMALKEIEQKNTEITESIQYARRIQQSILPDIESMRASFADFGVYYQARDIVSGDFYWYARSEGKLYLGAVDCTGHGVPGAFMSVMAYNLLNQAIKDRPGCAPERFLEHLDASLATALQLKKDGEAGTQTNDGMDIALLVFDPVANTISFAGAMRPMYYIRQGELHEVRGARFPIGGTQYGDKVWEGHTMSIETGDQYYITSDGLVDQFGGPNGRKFTPTKLKKLLLEVKDTPLQSQAEVVRREIEAWMQGYEQLDDLMIVAVKPR